jgi:perosamine synthetase
VPEPELDRSHPDFIPVAKPSIGDLERRYVNQALDACQLSAGPFVERFEREFAAAHGRKFGVACNSGTTALHLALVCADVHPGDVVAVPDHTMIAVANAALYCGAKLAVLGSDDFVGNVDGESLFSLAEHVKAKAAIAVHTYAQPVQNLQWRTSGLIEDCAEAHYVPGVGQHGRFACFSFYANKTITCGEGGMVLCDSENDAERLRSLRAHAFTPGAHFNHRELAFGYRMTELQGALGCAQHERRDEFIAARMNLCTAYLDATNHGGLSKNWHQPLWAGRLLWVYPLLCHDHATRDALRFRLADRHIETRCYFTPLSQQPHVKPHIVAAVKTDESQALAARGMYLPLFADMTEQQVRRVVQALYEFDKLN